MHILDSPGGASIGQVARTNHKPMLSVSPSWYRKLGI